MFKMNVRFVTTRVSNIFIRSSCVALCSKNDYIMTLPRTKIARADVGNIKGAILFSEAGQGPMVQIMTCLYNPAIPAAHWFRLHVKILSSDPRVATVLTKLQWVFLTYWPLRGRGACLVWQRDNKHVKFPCAWAGYPCGLVQPYGLRIL